MGFYEKKQAIFMTLKHVVQFLCSISETSTRHGSREKFGQQVLGLVGAAISFKQEKKQYMSLKN